MWMVTDMRRDHSILQNSVLGEAVGKIDIVQMQKEAKIMQARKAQSKVTAFTSHGSCVETGSGFRPCIFLFSFFLFFFDEGPLWPPRT